MSRKTSQRSSNTLCVIGLLVFVVGCGSEYVAVSTDMMPAESFPKSEAIIEEAVVDSLPSAVTKGAVRFATQAADATASDDQPRKTEQAASNRKIIYNTTIGLVVDDYKGFESQLPTLVEQYGGFVASSNTDRRYQDQQSGTWTVRVPASQYSGFLSGISALGFAESRSENAQDVTEEFVDIEARIKNKRTLEGRIVEMLQERSGKLADVLEIERELSRVREEIERMEGRIRYLKDRTSLATITIRCREQKEYQPAAAPTFSSRASSSWNGSVADLSRFAQDMVVGLIAVTPWLLTMILPGLGFVWWIRRRFFRTGGLAV